MADRMFPVHVSNIVIPFDQIEFEVSTIMPEVARDYIRKHVLLEIPPDRRVTMQAKH